MSNHDSTSIPQMQRELARLREQARIRSEFMARLAHELAGPLTPLVGYISILSSGRIGDLTDKQRQILNSMGNATDRLSRILDELVDYSAIDTGHYHLESKPFDAMAVVDRAVAEHVDKAFGKHVRVDVLGPKSAMLSGDETKVSHALSCLIENAVRVSPHGAHVLVHVVDAADRVTFEVYDHGPGISVDAQKDFQQRRDARSGHSGLGLPMARQIAEAHHGEVFMESPPKEQPEIRERFIGSRVGFWLPKA